MNQNFHRMGSNPGILSQPKTIHPKTNEGKHNMRRYYSLFFQSSAAICNTEFGIRLPFVQHILPVQFALSFDQKSAHYRVKPVVVANMKFHTLFLPRSSKLNL